MIFYWKCARTWLLSVFLWTVAIYFSLFCLLFFLLIEIPSCNHLWLAKYNKRVFVPHLFFCRRLDEFFLSVYLCYFKMRLKYFKRFVYKFICVSVSLSFGFFFALPGTYSTRYCFVCVSVSFERFLTVITCRTLCLGF